MATDFHYQPAQGLSAPSFLTDNGTASKIFIEQCFTKAQTEGNESVISFLNQIATDVGHQQISALHTAIEQLKPSKLVANVSDDNVEAVTINSQSITETSMEVKAIAHKFNIEDSTTQSLLTQTQISKPCDASFLYSDALAQPTDVELSRVVGKFNLN